VIYDQELDQRARRVGPIRTSDRSYFKRCRTLWNFTSKIRQNYEPHQRIQALDFGTAMHAALQAYYDPETWGSPVVQRHNAEESFLKSIKEVQQKVRVGPIDFEQQFEEDKELGLGMLRNYFLWAPKQDNFVPVYTEIEFAIPMSYRGFIFEYQGRVDLIIEDEYGYWIVDHKTAAQFGQTTYLALDDQFTSYAWALQQMLGLAIRGVLVNELRKKAPHPPDELKTGGFSRNKQQDTSFEVYLATLRAAGIDPRGYRDFLRYLKHNPKEWFRRLRVSYTPRQLEMVEGRIKLEAFEMLNDPAIYPTPNKFNCNGCSFYRPCLVTQEGGDPQLILDELYTKRKEQ
jgi:CRISPR/Cas system-associated exonuclease Cas4 (RecB family)